MISDGQTMAEFEDPHVKFLIGIEKNKNRSQKTVSGSQFRMPLKDVPRCDTCDGLNSQNKKMKEVIRSLKLQITRLEEKCHDLKMSKNGHGDFPVHSSGSFSASVKSENMLNSSHNDDNITNAIDLIRRCELLEEDLAKNKKLVQLERNSLEVLKKTHEDTKTSLNLDLLDRKNEILALTKELNAFKELHKNQESVIDHMNSNLLTYKQQLEKTENKLSDALIRLQASNQAASDVDNLREIERLKAELVNAENNAKTLSNNIMQLTMNLSTSENKLNRATSQITALEGQLETSAADLSKVSGDLKTTQEQLVAAKKRVEIMEITLKSTVSERDGFANNLSLREADLQIANQKIGSLESEIMNLNKKISDMLKRMASESENTKKALEKAISASVRLCVVAPTVNVHVADKKLKFKAGLSESALREFLNSEVLEKYSFLFKQKADNTAPNGGDLESWLQKMLSQMQSSIETHVNSAMDGSSL